MSGAAAPAPRAPLALVTGASGMIGGELAAQLAARGRRVRCLLRPASAGGRLDALPVEVVRADLEDPAAVAAAVAGASHVYHVAGYLHVGAPFSGGEDYAPYRAANVDLTARLLEASARAGVERFLFASTTAVYGPAPALPVTEESPTAPFSAYGRSKVEAEALVRAYAAAGRGATIVRPSATYGAGDRHFLPAALALARLRRVPLVDGGRHLVDFGHVSDVARLMLLAGESPAARGKTYNAASGRPQPLRDLFSEYAALTGQPAPAIIALPAGLCRALGPLLQAAIRLFAPAMGALVTREGLDYLARDVSFDMTRAQEDLGFRPRVDFRAGLALSLPDAHAPDSRGPDGGGSDAGGPDARGPDAPPATRQKR